MESGVRQTACDHCLKSRELCVCEHLKSFGTRLKILILQHPQEPDKDLGTARLAQLSIENSILRVGLSWANLKAALGGEVDRIPAESLQPSKWGVLYLGSGIQGDPSTVRTLRKGLHAVGRKGEPLPNEQEILSQLQGLVLLDGTWSQAKTLWWRNAWLLKLRRLVLLPKMPSLYRELRKEPRRECVSTIETLADCLEDLGESPEIAAHLRAVFGHLLQRKRAALGQKRA